MIRLLPDTEISTCDRPEDGKYIVQIMDTLAFEPVVSRNDKYFDSYDKAHKHFVDMADLIITKKTLFNWVFLARIIGTEYHLLEQFGFNKDN